MNNIITLQAIRTNCITGKELLVEIQVSRKYLTSEYVKGWWIEIVQGGVTGYESMQESHVKNMTDGWSACAGTKGLWDSLFIPGKTMMKLAQWIDERKEVKDV